MNIAGAEDYATCIDSGTGNREAGPAMTCRRLQLRRTKGWRLPRNTLKVDRSTPWGNPFRLGQKGPWGLTARTPAQAVSLFRSYLQVRTGLRARGRVALRGKHLACWCAPGQPCHADVWLELMKKT